MSSTGHNDVIPNTRPSHQASIVACAAITWIIAAIFVGLRLYLRGCLRRTIGSEDWVILASLVCSGCNSAGFIVGAAFGLGKHSEDVPETHWQPMIEAAWVTILFYTFTVCLSKVSVLLLYKRTLTYDWTRITVWIFIILVVLTSVVNIATVATACIPLDSFWNRNIKSVYCHSNDIYYAITGLQIATDFLIFLLPLPIVWSMRAPRDQKAMLITVFSFGFFICIVSIVRLIELSISFSKDDFIFTSVVVNYWTLIEVNTAIVCSCIMTLKPLLNRWFACASRPNTRTQDHQPAGVQGINPPTIGSEPSRKRKGALGRKQSWLSVQLARMDMSMQTVAEEVNLRTWSRDKDLDLEPPVELGAHEAEGRRSHTSSNITPVEQHADEGPLN